MASGERIGEATLETRLRRACADLDARRRRGEPARAETYLAADPELADDPEAAVELIYTEFVVRQELGEGPRPADFARRFPRWREPLEEQLQIHALVAGCDAPANEERGDERPSDEPPDPPSSDVVSPDEFATIGEPGELWLGRYELGRELGRGGVGVVFEARDARSDGLVAVKVLLAGPWASAAERDRWKREAAAEARLAHPNVVRILAVGEHRGRPTLVLELVAGRSLAEHIAGRPQPPRAAAALVERLARAIHFAHERGVLHRDLKPSNVLLAPRPASEATAWASEAGDGARYEPKITDFGLAKSFYEDSGRTRTGALVGTPSYMAPEQAGAGKYVGPASDVYSLGAVLYELLTGRPPFVGETALETLRRVVEEDPTPPRKLLAWAPRDLETICLKCLRKDPYQRYPTAAALADDLGRYLAHRAVAAREESFLRRCAAWVRKRPALAALAAAGVVALAVVGLLSVRHATLLAASNERLAAALREAQVHRLRAAREHDEAARQAELYRVQFEEARRGAYAERLRQASNQRRRDPGRARELLDDDFVCPPDLRDFSWRFLRRAAIERELGELAAPGVEFEWLGPSPDGKLVATFGPDRVVRWWPIDSDEAWADPRPTHAFPPTDAPIVAAAWSADGRSVITVDRAGAIRAADESGATRPLGAAGAGEEAIAAAFDAASRLVAIGHPSGKVRVVDAATGAETAAWDAHCGPSLRLAFEPRGRRLATAGEDGLVRVWGAPDWGLRVELPEQGSAVEAVACSSESNTVAVAYRDGKVRLWRAARERLAVSVGGHVTRPSGLAFSADGARLATAGRDGIVRVWSGLTGRADATFRGHAGEAIAVAFSPDGRRVLSAGFDRRVKGWSVDEARRVRELTGHSDSVLALAYSPDGGELASAARDGTIRVRDARSGETRRLIAGVGRVQGLAFSRDGATLYAAGEDRRVRSWSGPGETERSFEEHASALFGLSLSPDERWLAAPGEDGSVALWDATTGRLARVLADGAPDAATVAFAPDGRTLVIGGKDGALRLWDVARGEFTRSLEGHSDWVVGLAFSPDGRTLASASYDETVRLWDVATWTATRVFDGHDGQAMHVAFSADGKTLATAAGDRVSRAGGRVRLWDAVTGRLRLTLPGRGGPLVFSPDGRVLVAGDDRAPVVRVFSAAEPDDARPR